MIINIRGTSGSGKTSLVRALMEHQGIIAWQPFVGQNLTPIKQRDRTLATQLTTANGDTIVVVGSYENTCGGCDAIKTQLEVETRVRHYAAQGHDVVFEGLLISHLFARWTKLDDDMRAAGYGPYIWAFLDTPVDVCISRVQQRRLAAGNEKPLDETNTRQKWRDIDRCRLKAVAAGHDVRLLPWQSPLATLAGWLGLTDPAVTT